MNREQGLKRLYESFEPYNLNVVIVFDAYRTLDEVSRINYKKTEVVFTSFQQKADDYIIDAVSRSPNPSQLVAVTNDAFLAKEVQFLGGKTLSLKSFFLFLNKKEKRLKRDEKKNPCVSIDEELYRTIFEERFKDNNN
ncbi:MAG: hypothetical protein S4CHLAM7_11080 [Chlamydiae bacterium]|nr:hypothetical protein [Chlamydiota bacterium]